MWPPFWGCHSGSAQPPQCCCLNATTSTLPPRSQPPPTMLAIYPHHTRDLKGPQGRKTATKRHSPYPKAHERAKRATLTLHGPTHFHETYEHTEWCMSTPDGPPTVPEAHEHAKWPRNDTPTPPGPASMPNGPRRPDVPHGPPLPEAFEHAKWAQHSPIPSPRLMSTLNVHHDPRRPPK
ncbi:hypothetical protein BDN67DRAFT_985846 [Paxillus ammoniavirescens]|nr:hypothetical protein BDN67DRAFT_985846 [Paxillus ammoniavirescens]